MPKTNLTAWRFKKSTGELKAGLATLCAFLNYVGGKVLFGVTEGGKIRGQDISNDTMREVANFIQKLEPQEQVAQTRVRIKDTLEVLILEVEPGEYGPCGPRTLRRRARLSMSRILCDAW